MIIKSQPRYEICEKLYLPKDVLVSALPPSLILGNFVPHPLWASFPMFEFRRLDQTIPDYCPKLKLYDTMFFYS